MSLEIFKDFVLIKNAVYSEGKMIKQSGNLIVTKNKIILNVIQTIDLLEIGKTKDTGSIKEAFKDVKEGFHEAKDSFKKIFDYKGLAEMVKNIAAGTSDIKEFENSVIELGKENPKSLVINTKDVKNYTMGFFKGFQILLNDNTLWKIRSSKLGKIKKFLNIN